jgi:hypothetical protein
VFFTFSNELIIEFKSTWDEKKNVCFPCDLNPENKFVEAVKTLPLNLKGNFNFSYEIISKEYKTIKVPYIISKALLPEQNFIEVNFSKAQVDNFITLKNVAITKKNGLLQLLTSVKIKVIYSPKLESQNRGATFANESVLRKGKWYKFGVNKSGVYKLTKTDLENAGISTSGLNPQHINIYANHIPQLPYSNSAFHPDDLVKNSIFISGESDGSFDSNDFILFFATGSIVETNNGVKFDLFTNNNDSLNYFYLSIDASESPKRIQTLSNSTMAVTHNLTTFDAAVLHEQEDTNLLKSGDVWLGEFFDVETSKTLSITLPGINTSMPVNLFSRIAFSKKTGTCSFNHLYNGTSILTISGTSNSSIYNLAKVESGYADFSVSSKNFDLQIDFNKGGVSSSVGWLDKLVFNYKRNLSLSDGQFICQDLLSVGIGNVAKYNVSSISNDTKVWEVTDPRNVKELNVNVSGSNLTFIQNADSLRRFAVFNTSGAFSPIFIKEVSNQNLHALGFADYLIVTHEDFTSQANRLADLHRNKGLTVHVVEIQKIYNEFSGGVSDLVAIRWFAKMFYDRAAGDVTKIPQSLLLFGDGSYDQLNRKNNNTAKLPTFRSEGYTNSYLTLTSSYTSDDFFTLLDDGESASAGDLMDLGVGRFPVNTIDEATTLVNKVEHYMNYGSNLFGGIGCDNNGETSTFGDWRSRYVIISDDDETTFFNDCENISSSIINNHYEMNVIKIYMDAYQQVVTSGGERYPDVERAINDYVNYGALIFTYIGHGGEVGLAAERIVSIPMIEAWSNINKLPVFVTATCEFSRFDDPDRVSAGEKLFLSPVGGAISMLTTTRLVYISTNSTLNSNLSTVFLNEVNGEPQSLGEIMRKTKNLTAGLSSMRNFTLLGDPALKLGKPRPTLVIDSLNGVAINGAIDTLKSLSYVKMSGHVEDYLGNPINNFNGLVYPTMYDKPKLLSTLGNKTGDPKPYYFQFNILYKGKSTVKNGKFSFDFIVPKDIDYAFGKGKASLYAHNEGSDKIGFDTTFVVGGVDPNGLVDNTPPEIDLYLNDENFVSGGVTDSKPLLIAKISDENGINTSGNGIGHDITLTLDGNAAEAYVLNNFYEADLDTYKSGKVQYQFTDLEEGQHQMTLKVWDVNNNSAEVTIDFVVAKKENLTISHLLNYPNPFTTHTDFYFEHNQLHSLTEVRIEIFTVTGKLVKTIYTDVNSCAYRSEAISWNGLDEYGDKLARGVYIYRLTVKSENGQKAEKIEKLYIL